MSDEDAAETVVDPASTVVVPDTDPPEGSWKTPPARPAEPDRAPTPNARAYASALDPRGARDDRTPIETVFVPDDDPRPLRRAGKKRPVALFVFLIAGALGAFVVLACAGAMLLLGGDDELTTACALEERPRSLIVECVVQNVSTDPERVRIAPVLDPDGDARRVHEEPIELAPGQRAVRRYELPGLRASDASGSCACEVLR